MVAALTMPSLISHHRKQVVETKLKRFYSTMNQAIQLSEIDDNGDKMSWNFHYDMGGYDEETLTLFFNTYLKNYINTTKTEYKNRRFFIYFADGSVAALGYYGNDINYFIEPKYIDSCEQGKNCFLFGFYPNCDIWTKRYKYFYGKGVEPYIHYQWDGTRDELKLPVNCAKLIQLNGWKIPDDYPYKL